MTIMIFQLDGRALRSRRRRRLGRWAAGAPLRSSDDCLDAGELPLHDGGERRVVWTVVVKPADNTLIVQIDTCQRTDKVSAEDTNVRHDNHQAFIILQNNIVNIE